MSGQPVHVTCYSGHTYAERPTAFEWRGDHFEVETIEALWREPDGPRFRVRTADGGRFRLTYDEAADQWALKPIE